MLKLLILCVVIGLIAGNSIDKPTSECKTIGDSCFYHWECCSNSCLSYLYKCVKTNNPANQLENHQQSASTEPEQLNSNLTSLEALIEHAFTPSASNNQTETAIPTNNNNAILLNSRIDDQSDTTINDKQTMQVTECLEVGKKCYRHEECCTQRCHGFLHQCVT